VSLYNLYRQYVCTLQYSYTKNTNNSVFVQLVPRVCMYEYSRVIQRYFDLIVPDEKLAIQFTRTLHFCMFVKRKNFLFFLQRESCSVSCNAIVFFGILIFPFCFRMISFAVPARVCGIVRDLFSVQEVRFIYE